MKRRFRAKVLKKFKAVPLGFWLRLAVCLAVLGSIYYFGYVHRHSSSLMKTNEKVSETARFKTLLEQDYITLSSLFELSGTSPNTSDSLQNIRQQLGDLQKSLSDETPKNILHLSIEDNQQLQAIVANQKMLLDNFDKQFPRLSKALQYNPADDLGSLQLPDKKDTLSTRLQATQKALGAIQDNTKTQGAAAPYLSKSLDCFAAVSAQLDQNRLDDARSSISLCSSSYSSTRKELYTKLLKDIEQGTSINTRQVLSNLLAKLNT